MVAFNNGDGEVATSWIEPNVNKGCSSEGCAACGYSGHRRTTHPLGSRQETKLMSNKHIRVQRKESRSRRESNRGTEKKTARGEGESGGPYLDIGLLVEQGLSCCNDKHRGENHPSEAETSGKTAQQAFTTSATSSRYVGQVAFT